MEIRDEIVDAVIKEIVGPDPDPKYKDEKTGEEILLANVHGSPKSRYGAGMLYPQQELNQGVVNEDEAENEDNFDETDIDEENVDGIIKNKRSPDGSDGQDEEPVGMANQYLPSAMGFTVRFNNQKDDEIKLLIRSAFYQKAKDKKPKKQLDKVGQIVTSQSKDGKTFESDYWTRRPINPEQLTLNLNSLIPQNKKSYDKVINQSANGSDWLKLRVFDRTTSSDREENLLTYTFVLINSLHSVTDDCTNPNKILYQNELTLKTDNASLIVPYKEKELKNDTNEEKELNLLYRKKRVYSIGHGTSVEWKVEENGSSNYEIVKQVKTSVIPVYDLPQVAPTAHVSLSMLELSDLGDWEKGKGELKNSKRKVCILD